MSSDDQYFNRRMSSSDDDEILLKKSKISESRNKIKKDVYKKKQDSDDEVKNKKKRQNSNSDDEVKNRKRRLEEDDEDDKPKKTKKRSSDSIKSKKYIENDSSDEEIISKQKKFKTESSDEEIIKKHKKIKTESSDDEPPKKQKKFKTESSDDEPPKKQKKFKTEISSDDEHKPSTSSKNKKSKDKKAAVDFEKLTAYATSAFLGKAQPMKKKEVVDSDTMKNLLTTLIDRIGHLDDCVCAQYSKAILILTQVLLHRQEFDEDDTTTKLDTCFDAITIPNEWKKWEFQQLTIPHLNKNIFNQAMEIIFAQFQKSSYTNTFQEFLSSEGNINGFENLMPFVDYSSRRGKRIPNSTGVNVGVGIAGDFISLGKHVDQKSYTLSFADINTNYLSKFFNNTPSVQINCGTLKNCETFGTLKTNILLMGGFADFHVYEGNILKLKAYICAKIGETKKTGIQLLEYLKTNDDSAIVSNM